ncbi:MAG: hypothetical protein ACE5G2_12230, partial [Candidatus Krumholzibacteriia bacterium]
MLDTTDTATHRASGRSPDGGSSGTGRGGHRAARRACGLLLLVALVLACGEDDPTSLGSESRTPPDTLRTVELTAVQVDTVFHLPVSLGQSPTGQLGSQAAYTTHILYAFRVPSFVVDEAETLRLDTANLRIAADSLGATSFEGTMRLSLREVTPQARGWSTDSILTGLPDLEPGSVAPDISLSGDDITSGTLEIDFAVDLGSLVDFDSVRANADTLAVNVAVVFSGFEDGGPGLVDVPYKGTGGGPTASFIGFSDDEPAGAIVTVNPERQLTVVEFDAAYSPGTNLVVSDGYRMHTYLKFEDVSSVLPESALVHLADLILTQVNSEDSIFGVGPEMGVMVPAETTLTDTIFSEEQNTRSLAFTTSLVAFAGGEVAINVTAYYVD